MSNQELGNKKANIQDYMPSGERVIAELSQAKSIDDFFGREGILAKLFAKTLEAMLEAEMTEHLGYEAYEAKGRNSGNNRNGHRSKKIRTSGGGEMEIEVPRDRNSAFTPQIVRKYETSSNELEDKIITLYGKGLSTRDITETLQEMYGMEVSAQTITTATRPTK